MNTFTKTLLLVALFLLILFLYLPGITGSLYYDDFRPLGALSQVNNLDSALVYMFSETSGPLGRSLSMATFLLHVNDWPNNLSAFFTFNIILHLVNGLLVFFISLLISRLYYGSRYLNYWLSLATTAFWLVLPIHVSTSLIAIQRMAGLSALFVLAGLAIYLYGLYKQSIANHLNNSKGLVWQVTGAFFFTLLAMFSKENGVLLPIFILVLEVTLLANLKALAHRRQIRIFAGSVCLLTLLGYMFFITINTGNELIGREFTVFQRVITQPQILIEYLQLAFLPDVAAFNPFHDNYEHVINLLHSPQALFACLASVIVFSSAIYFRRKYPLTSFAILWFFAAHMLESSFIGLELYFQHRNYVALVGPCLAIVFALGNIPVRYKTMSISLAILYWLLLCFSLSQTTRLWGEPMLAAKTWAQKQQGSNRANEHLSILLYNKNLTDDALKITLAHLKSCPSCLNTRARAMLLSCYLDLPFETKQLYLSMFPLINEQERVGSVAVTLRDIYLMIKKNYCKHIGLTELEKLNTVFLQLPKSPFNKKLLFIQNLYMLALDNKNVVQSIRLLKLAWKELPSPQVATELVSILLASNNYQEAVKFVKEEACNIKPKETILTIKEKTNCSMLLDKINKSAKQQDFNNKQNEI